METPHFLVVKDVRGNWMAESWERLNEHYSLHLQTMKRSDGDLVSIVRGKKEIAPGLWSYGVKDYVKELVRVHTRVTKETVNAQHTKALGMIDKCEITTSLVKTSP